MIANGTYTLDTKLNTLAVYGILYAVNGANRAEITLWQRADFVTRAERNAL